MEFQGEYVGWGNRAVIFKLSDGDCFKIYRIMTGRHIPEKEYDLFEKFNEEGINVPKPKDIIELEFSSSTLDQITNKVLHKEFSNSTGPFFALRRDFIEGKLMGKSWFPSGKIWQNYLDLNEAIFALGYSPSDFIPHNYIVTPEEDVFFIDADKVRDGAPEYMGYERKYMRKVPNTHRGRAIFDVKRFCLESIGNILVRGQ